MLVCVRHLTPLASCGGGGGGGAADLCDAPAFNDTYALKPPAWPVKACELGKAVASYNPWSPEFGSSGHGYENEDLIVWMRTAGTGGVGGGLHAQGRPGQPKVFSAGAALPNFRKLYRRVTTDLPDGEYRLAIDYSALGLKDGAAEPGPGAHRAPRADYPVSAFGGKKRVILSTTSWMGGKNNFLGIAYLVVGCVTFVMGVVFLVLEKSGILSRSGCALTRRLGFHAHVLCRFGGSPATPTSSRGETKRPASAGCCQPATERVFASAPLVFLFVVAVGPPEKRKSKAGLNS